MTASALAPASLPRLPDLGGVRLASAEAGIRYQGRKDLLLVLLDPGTTVAGVLTRSRTASAPVDWCRSVLPSGAARALVVNSGNANAFTGRKGAEAVRLTAEAAAAAAECNADEVLLASTGVIGEALDVGQFAHLLSDLAAAARPGGWPAAAEAIITTDTYPKLVTVEAPLGEETVTINGIAKGAGMIAPDMATMLAFLFTDAPLSAHALRGLLPGAVDRSFNAITVDGDTSTSDTVLVFATGAARARGVTEIGDPADPRLQPFARALQDAMLDLAHQIVRDGEGVTKFASVRVEGAESDVSAKRIALAIANSPLVKTALAGEDPNWGRIVMAVGKAGEPADRDRLSIWIGEVRAAVNGELDPAYDESLAAAHMKGSHIDLRVDIGLGQGRAQVWTCDLTKDYISINADYRS